MSADLSGWVRVEDSIEVALGCGIIAMTVDRARSPFIREVRCDPGQTGDEAEFIVVGGSEEVGLVYLRCRVDEVRPSDDSRTPSP